MILITSCADRLVFASSRPSEDRTIPLGVISERTKLSIEDVEYLLMKSLSVSLFLLLKICKLCFIPFWHVLQGGVFLNI